MVATYRLKGLGWLTLASVVAIGFYLVSSQAAAERKKLDAVAARIAAAQRDIRALETEFDVRANMAQLERWNGETLSLTVPTARQFVRSGAALARLSPFDAGAVVPGAEGGEVQTAALIVPSTPVVAAPVLHAAAVPAAVTVPTAAAAVVRTAAVAVPATGAGLRKVAMLDEALIQVRAAR